MRDSEPQLGNPQRDHGGAWLSLICGEGLVSFYFDVKEKWRVTAEGGGLGVIVNYSCDKDHRMLRIT